MSSKLLHLTSLASLLLVALAADATEELPDCNCYFIQDCPAEKPICRYTLNGSGPVGPTDPDRACEWRTPKPVGVGTGCDQPIEGDESPCDGVCQAETPTIETRGWEHRDGRPGPPYQGAGCFAGGPYSYFVKLIVENEACDLPAHCSLCESEVFVPSGTLAAGTASLVASALSTECSAAGFTINVTDTTVEAEIEGQVFDVCVNGVNVTAPPTMPPRPAAVVCQDGSSPSTYQVAGDVDPIVIPALSAAGFALLVSAILVAVLGQRGSRRA